MLNSLLEPHKSGPIKLAGVKRDEIIGFVRPLGLDKLSEEEVEHWDMSDCQIDDGFMLRLRLERRSVPASLLQLLYKQRFAEWTKKTGKAPHPKERRELKEALKAELMAKALPQMAHVDAFWRDRHGELLLFTASNKAKAAFETLFTNCFAAALNLTLVRIDPPLMGLPKAHWDDSQVATETLGRLSLTTPVAFAEQIYP